MKQKILIYMAMLVGIGQMAGAVGKETIGYDIMYKWGLINKKAGEVSVTTYPSGSRFKSELIGITAPWADKFYIVRDTLRGEIDNQTLLPYSYEKISHEGGSYAHDRLTYRRNGKTTTADATIERRRKKETETSHDSKVHTAEGTTVDMLSAFYYMRSIDYTKMKNGEAVVLNVFSGRRKEILTIRYEGMEDVKIGKRILPAYHIVFTFTTEGGKVSSDKMEAWISTDKEHIPLLMEGKLPVGKVRAVYSGI